jgi:hypothetical protein
MTLSMPLGEIIGTRELTFTPKDGVAVPVRVEIGAPVRDPHGDWLCPYAIRAETFKKQFGMAGVDSMQALVHTVLIISVELEALAKKHGGTFHFLGDADLSFPPYGSH